jgi:hypothetical protein
MTVRANQKEKSRRQEPGGAKPQAASGPFVRWRWHWRGWANAFGAKCVKSVSNLKHQAYNHVLWFSEVVYVEPQCRCSILGRCAGLRRDELSVIRLLDDLLPCDSR